MNKTLYNDTGGQSPPANLDSRITQQEQLTLTVNEMAQQLHISRASAYKLANAPSFFPAFRLGGRVLIGADALRRWVHEQTGG